MFPHTFTPLFIGGTNPTHPQPSSGHIHRQNDPNAMHLVPRRVLHRVTSLSLEWATGALNLDSTTLEFEGLHGVRGSGHIERMTCGLPMGGGGLSSVLDPNPRGVGREVQLGGGGVEICSRFLGHFLNSPFHCKHFESPCRGCQIKAKQARMCGKTPHTPPPFLGLFACPTPRG